MQAYMNWDLPTLSTSFLTDLFPYGIVFGPALRLLDAGQKLRNLFPQKRIISCSIDKIFRVKRPKGLDFTWKNVSKIDYPFNKSII